MANGDATEDRFQDNVFANSDCRRMAITHAIGPSCDIQMECCSEGRLPKLLIVVIVVACAVGGAVPVVALAKPRSVTAHHVRRGPTRCRKRDKHYRHRCRFNKTPKRKPKPTGVRHAPQVSRPPLSPLSLPTMPSGQPNPPGPPVCQLPILPVLPAGAGGTAIVGGILSGGPGGTCASTSNSLLGGAILVETEGGSVIAEKIVSEHEYFEVLLSPGIYRVSGARYAPKAIPITCGPATSLTEFAGGGTVPVVERQSTYIYCEGDIP